MGPTHLEGLVISLLTSKDELLLLVSYRLNTVHKKLLQNLVAHKKYFLPTCVLVGWSRLGWVWLNLYLGSGLLHVSPVILGPAAPGSSSYGHT